MNFMAEVEVDIDEVFDGMSDYDKKKMFELLQKEKLEEFIPRIFEENITITKITELLKGLQREIGFGKNRFYSCLKEGIESLEKGVPIL